MTLFVCFSIPPYSVGNYDGMSSRLSDWDETQECQRVRGFYELLRYAFLHQSSGSKNEGYFLCIF